MALSLADTVSSSPTFFTSGIEVLSVTNAAAAYTLDAANMTGLTTVQVNGGTAALTVNNATAILNAEVAGSNSNLSLSTAALKVAGEADAASISLNSVGTDASVTITNNGIETLNVSAKGGASGSATTAVTLASDELERVVLTGDKAVTLVANLTGADASAQVAVFDASAATGDVTATLTAGGSGKLSVTGGSGSDTIVTTASVTKDMTIAGGAGTDVLVTTTGTYSSSASPQPGANVSGFEVISARDAGSVDLRSFANNTFGSIYGAGTYTGVNAALASATLVSGDLSVTRGTDGAADALSVDLAGKAATTYASVSLADEETVTLNAGGVGASGVTHTISALALGDTTTLNVTGNRGLVVTALTGEEGLARIDASKHTGQELKINAADSNVAMTIIGSAGTPVTASSVVNTLTGGSKADNITGGDNKDVLTGGLGSDTLSGGGGDDSLTGDNGNDSILGGAGNDTISGGVGDDYLDGGDGNDLIDAGSGTDTVVGGAGNDNIKISLSDNTNVDGGAGTDRVANTTGSITSTTASSVDGAFVTVAESAAPTLTSVESAYVSINADASTGATDYVTLDLTKATSLTSLFLETADAEPTRVLNFAGSSVRLYGATDGAVESEDLILDGIGQAALTVTLENYDHAADTGKLTVTGAQSLTVAGRSTSQFTGSADQTNTLGDIVAASVDTLTISSSGSAAANANALVIDDVTATLASTITVTVGAFDNVDIDNINASGDAAENVTVTVGADGILDIEAINLDAASVDAVTITLGAGSVMNKDGSGTVTTEKGVNLSAAAITTLTTTLAAGAEAHLDLSGIEVTAGSFSVDSSSNLTLDSSLGVAGKASSFTFTGRGDVDFDVVGTGLGNTVTLAGSSVTFNTSGLTVDAEGFSVTGTAGADSITTGLGNDSITGGDGNDSISTGVGADTLVGGDGADTLTGGNGADVITGGAGNDTIALTDTDSAVDTVVLSATAALNGVDTITGFAKATDVLNWLQGDLEVAVTGTITATADDLFQLGGQAAGAADTAAAAATALNAAATWVAGTALTWIAISDDNSTSIYQWQDVTGTAGVQADELTLVATISTAMTTAELATAFTIA